MSIRKAFEERFGADQAEAIYTAAIEHSNGINNKNKGSDPFKWALCIALGYQCMEVEEYREYHGITAPWKEVKQWIKDNAELSTHDGSFDYLAALAGVYNEYVRDI